MYYVISIYHDGKMLAFFNASKVFSLSKNVEHAPNMFYETKFSTPHDTLGNN